MILKSGTSRGNQIKVTKDNNFIKIDTPGWCESVSEVVAAEFQYHISNRVADFVDYSFCLEDGLNACICKNFLSEEESLISLYSLIKSYNLPKEGIDLVDAICGILMMDHGISAYEYLGYMLELDAILLNEDRHLRNISLISSNDGSLRFSPIYDNGMSLLSDWRSYKTIDDMSKVRSCTFSDDFIKQVKYFSPELLLIDYTSLYDKLTDVICNTDMYVNESREKFLIRAVTVLLKRLQDTEGVLWRRI